MDTRSVLAGAAGAGVFAVVVGGVASRKSIMDSLSRISLPSHDTVMKTLDELPYRLAQGVVALGIILFVWSLVREPFVKSLEHLGIKKSPTKLGRCGSEQRGSSGGTANSNKSRLLEELPAGTDSAMTAEQRAELNAQKEREKKQKIARDKIEREVAATPDVHRNRLCLRSDGVRLGYGESSESNAQHVSGQEPRRIKVAEQPREFGLSARGKLLRAENEERKNKLEADKALRRARQQERFAEQARAAEHARDQLRAAQAQKKELVKKLAFLDEQMEANESRLKQLKMSRRRLADQLSSLSSASAHSASIQKEFDEDQEAIVLIEREQGALEASYVKLYAELEILDESVPT